MPIKCQNSGFGARVINSINHTVLLIRTPDSVWDSGYHMLFVWN